MSSLPLRTDARRNASRILDAAAELLAADPDASLERIAAAAGVSRVTLYNRFASRDALLAALGERAVGEVVDALAGARPGDGAAADALARMLRAAWPVIGRYRGLAAVNRRRPPAELRAGLAPALEPLQAVLARGRRAGEFDAELPVGWLTGVIIDLVHGASAQVSAQTMTPAEAERALLRSARRLVRAGPG